MKRPSRRLARYAFGLAAVWLGLFAVPAVGQAACDGFVDAVADSTAAYHAEHRIHPLSEAQRETAERLRPRLWTSPDSARPIDFSDYLAKARLYHTKTGEVLAADAIPEAVARLSILEQCETHLEADEITARTPAPVYVQLFRDSSPIDPHEEWLYYKYTFVFDWSGLARKRSFLTRLGGFLAGGDVRRWHRLDVHTAAVLGVDANGSVRTLTLAQHNNKRTYAAGVHFDPNEPIHLAAAEFTNELYLDTGSSRPEFRRAVPSFMQWRHLIDADQGGALSQVDSFRGRNAGGHEAALQLAYPKPNDLLATYSGLLAPPSRILGFYVGRDGPPGYDFTGVPEIPHAVALGFWEEGDEELLTILETHLDGFRSSNWDAIRAYLTQRLDTALSRSSRRAPR